MPALRICLFLLVCITCVFETNAQVYTARARRYSIEDGLPHRQVNSLMQDRQGFIWAATNGGLARFDGQHFKVFNTREHGLSGDLVIWVIEAPDGYIWANRTGSNGWLDVLDPLTGAVTPASEFFRENPLPEGVLDVSYWPVYLPDSTLIFTMRHQGGFWKYHPKNGWSNTRLSDCRFFGPGYVTKRGTIWGVFVDVMDQVSLVESDPDGRILSKIQAPPRHGFMMKKGGSGRNDGFFVMETLPVDWPVHWEIDGNGNRTPAPDFVENPFLSQYARLPNGIVVQFPLILDPEGHVLLDISKTFPEIDPTQYRDFIVDRSGNLWFATAFGLVVVELRKNHFRRLMYATGMPGGRGNASRGLLEVNGRLFVNLEQNNSGRHLLDLQTGSVQRLQGQYGIGMAKSIDGNIWSDVGLPKDGYWNISVAKTNLDGQIIGPHLVKKKENGNVWTILEESPDRVLLGHLSGLTVYNPLTGAAEPMEDAAFPKFGNTMVSWLQRDRSGQIWACTESGLYRLKPGGGIAEQFWSGGAGEHYLPYDNLYHLYEDADGVFWLSTGGGGLIRWDRKAPPGKQLKTISRTNGLLNGVVYAAYEDRHQHLWLPTDYGIVQIDKKTLQVRRTWLEPDGVTNNEFNRESHCQGADGTLYFGGLNGITAFQPDAFYTSINSDPTGHPLVISDFGIFDGNSGKLENHTADLVKNRRITLHPGDRYMQLEFALLDYIAPEKVTYTWLLEGVTDDWENLKEPVLRLSSLPYGTHRLRIRAQAADGSLAGNELDIRLAVLAPVYLRWWFLVLAALALVLAVGAWLRWRTREHRRVQERLESEVQRQTATIRRQTEELKKLDEAKSRFFANVSHELRTPLTLMLGPIGSMLKARRLDERDFSFAKTAHTHGKQLLHLVNEILDLSKMESGKMKLQETTVSIQPFLRRVVSAFESHAERLGILFVFEYRVADRLRLLADEDKLQKVMNNLLSNALKFTPPHAGGSVRVQVDETEGFVRIGVHDTGRGIHPDDLPHVFERFYQTSQAGAPIEGGTGIGLALCREFAEVMQGRIRVESKPGAGSSFYFEFPKKEVLGIGQAGDEPEAEVQEPDFMEVPTLVVAADPERPVVLLVEDNPSLRDYVASILSGQYRIVAAENGRMAFDHLLAAQAGAPESRLPDLIVSDVMMPVMDGFQLLEALKGDDRWRHIPVIMLTARADMRDKLRALRTGVDDYLLKPFEEDELLARIDNLLRNYRNRMLLREDATKPAQSAPSPVTISAEDRAWLERFELLLDKRLGDFNLTAEMLAEEMAMSRAPFFRHLKRLTGLTPAQYLDEARFQKARSLFETRQSNSVKAVAYKVGFRQVKHFSQNYKKRFGKLPSEVIG